MDLTVLVEHGGKVRTIDGFEALFSRAGLAITRAVDKEWSFTIIESKTAD